MDGVCDYDGEWRKYFKSVAWMVSVTLIVIGENSFKAIAWMVSVTLR